MNGGNNDLVFDFLITSLIGENIAACFRQSLIDNNTCLHCGGVHNSINIEENGMVNDGNVVKEEEVECSECSKKVAASRFASHLEKCLGMSGRFRKATTNSSPPTSPSKKDRDRDEIQTKKKKK